MKRVIIYICMLLFMFGLAGCTLNYDEQEEFLTEPEVTTEEEITEKEELVPLLAENEADELYLYGIKPDGVILYADGEGHYFDWEYSCADYRQPRIFKGHFDGDDSEDIAVVTYTKCDGESVEDLRFITDGDFGADDVYLVDEYEFNSYVAHHIDHSYANHTITFSLGDVNYSFDLSENFETLVFQKVSYSENVTYEFVDGEIYVNIIPVFYSGDAENDYGKTEVDLIVRAKLVFDGYNISLTDAQLRPNLI
ncbi:MAG: hypothetical protein J6Q94_07535 [Clostridia bacterium]|nr:hypothetical protein [Clostridia bacterium]